MAQFCHEAAIARAVLWEARRGFNWTDPEIWGQIVEQIERVEAHDAKPPRHLGPSPATRHRHCARTTVTSGAP